MNKKAMNDNEPDMDYFEECIANGDLNGAMECFGDRDPMEFL